ncbi:hypothetical protein [Sandarakinorhabdus sp. AAP62]|uniref:O-antigen ligase family protein n=1 Tax=Sandarakinorhabdus sp. AAP62 TaxID=1248916 RepID=UPI0012680697|nr:hypothetical protein [Sandarakinorhabdus sp. AAP62]
MSAVTFSTRAAMDRKSARILPQYNSLHHRTWWKFATVAFVALALFLTMYTGFLVAIGGTLAFRFVGFPILVMAGVSLWMLPDVDKADNPPFYKLLTIYMFLMVAWPSYVAIAIPGLPWVTPPRLVLGVLLIAMLTHFPQIAEARRKVVGLLGYDPLAFKLYGLFLLMQVVVLPLAPSPIDVFSYEMMQGVLDSSAMVAAAWCFADVKKIPRLMRLVVLAGILSMLITVLENYLQRPPWFGYIPSFFRIDPVLYETYVSPQARIGDGRYRIRATFGIVLYYAQYLGLILPPLLYEMFKSKGWKRVLALALIPLILQTVWFINARTATIALLVSLFSFAGLMMVRQLFFRPRGDGLKPGIMVALVLLGVAMLGGAIATSHRARMYTIGGSQHAGSNAVRDAQWAGAWRAVGRNPIGVGLGTPLPDVGLANAKGVVIVDSYWINLLVGVGPLGFIGFMGCLARIAWLGGMTFLRAKDDLEEWGGVLAVSLLNFIISAYVISFADNNYLVFTLAVAILALHRHQAKRIAAEPKAERALPSPSTALVRR